MEVERIANRALVGGTIHDVIYIEGRPGGPNNDCVQLKMTSGVVVNIDAYSGGSIYVTRG